MTQPNPGRRPGNSRSSSRPRSSSQGSRQDGSRSRSSSPRKRSAPPKLSAWQKLLKTLSFGLYDPASAAPPARREQADAGAGARDSERGSAPAKERSRDKGPRNKTSGPKGALIIEPETPRLYVGNLDYDVDEADLEALFAEIGTVVSASVVRRGGTDRSKGFGFVVMANVEEAKTAKARFHDQDYKGRPLLVSGAKSEGPEGGSDGERSSDSSPRRSRRDRGSDTSDSSEQEGSDPDSSDEEGERPRSRERGERSERGGRERGERGGRERSGRGDDRRRSGGGRPSRIDDPEDRGSRNVVPREVEVVTTPTVLISNLAAEAGSESFTELFEGIGQVQASEAQSEKGQVQVTFAEVAEAQRAVELLHRKSYMGETLEVRGVGETVSVTSDA